MRDLRIESVTFTPPQTRRAWQTKAKRGQSTQPLTTTLAGSTVVLDNGLTVSVAVQLRSRDGVPQNPKLDTSIHYVLPSGIDGPERVKGAILDAVKSALPRWSGARDSANAAYRALATWTPGAAGANALVDDGAAVAGLMSDPADDEAALEALTAPVAETPQTAL